MTWNRSRTEDFWSLAVSVRLLNCGVPGALFTPGAHADFTEDDQRAEGAFGVIVVGGTAEADEGEYFGVFARAGDEAFPEVSAL
jgi:hypothetical protein